MGPVDFKFSRGANAKIVVEAKLSDSSSLLRNYENQVEIYRKTEKARKAYYLVIQVSEKEDGIQKLHDIKNARAKEGLDSPEIIVVDATPKKPASKA